MLTVPLATARFLIGLGLLTQAAGAQPFEDPLEVTMIGQYSVTRIQAGTAFLPITVATGQQVNVPLIWINPPVFQITCTNDYGWSVTLKGPTSGQLSGPSGSGLPIDYQYGTGCITCTPTSDQVVAHDSRFGGSLHSGVKTVSVAPGRRGGYRYVVGNFVVPRLPATQLAGTYGGAGLLTTTFANTP